MVDWTPTMCQTLALQQWFREANEHYLQEAHRLIGKTESQIRQIRQIESKFCGVGDGSRHFVGWFSLLWSSGCDTCIGFWQNIWQLFLALVFVRGIKCSSLDYLQELK